MYCVVFYDLTSDLDFSVSAGTKFLGVTDGGHPLKYRGSSGNFRGS